MSVPAIEGVPVECCKVCHGVTPGPAAHDYTAVTAYARAYAIIEHGYCMCALLDVEHIMASVTGHSATFPPEPAQAPPEDWQPLGTTGDEPNMAVRSDGAVAVRMGRFNFGTPPAPGLGEFYAELADTGSWMAAAEAAAPNAKQADTPQADIPAVGRQTLVRRAEDIPDLKGVMQAYGLTETFPAVQGPYDGPLPQRRETETTGPHYYPELAPEALGGISAPSMTVYGGEIPPDREPEGSGVRHFLDRARHLFKGHGGGHHQASA